MITRRIMATMATTGAAAFILAGCGCWNCCFSPREEIKESKSATVGEVKNITTAELAEMMQKKQAPILVDARGASDETIPGSVAVRFDASDAEIAGKLPDKNAVVVTYCANSRCTASPMLAKRLHKLGYSTVMEYPDGIAGWKDAGHKVHATK